MKNININCKPDIILNYLKPLNNSTEYQITHKHQVLVKAKLKLPLSVVHSFKNIQIQTSFTQNLVG